MRETDINKVIHLRQNVKCHHEWYGSSYGGFYIIPRFLNDSSIVYSFGIGKDISFDLKCMKIHNCHIYAFDPTPISIEFIKNQKLPDLFHFHEYGIGASSAGFVEFYLPENVKGVSGSMVSHSEIDKNRKINVLMKPLNEILRELGHRHIDVLKMDIEGSEYDVLFNILEHPVTIDQILVEFHDRLFDQQEFRSKEIVRKLRENGYLISASSISFEEVSFIHRRKLGI